GPENIDVLKRRVALRREAEPSAVPHLGDSDVADGHASRRHQVRADLGEHHDLLGAEVARLVWLVDARQGLLGLLHDDEASLYWKGVWRTVNRVPEKAPFGEFNE